jgi:superfamily I DNA and/or RNA helicase
VYAVQKAFSDDREMTPFDWVIIDEGSQLRVAESLLAISRLHPKGRLLIVGDDRQLPPIVNGVYPEPPPGQPRLHRSIFEALRDPDRGQDRLTRLLYENFRMNDVLCAFPAACLYGTGYRGATAQVEQRRMHLAPTRKAVPAWLKAALSPDHPWTLVVLDGVRATDENRIEAGLVAEVANALRRRLRDERTGKPWPETEAGDQDFWRHGLFIVSPHHAQLRAIRAALTAQGLRPPFFADTVDKMQGQECQTVIVSYGVADVEYALEEAEFIYSLNRLNVAVTRAQAKCVVFLSRPLLEPALEALDQPGAAEGAAFMRALFEHVREDIGWSGPLADGAHLTVYRRGG